MNRKQKKNTVATEPFSASLPLVSEKNIFVKWQLAIVFAFACLLYVQTISYDYALDDAIVILNNKFTQKGFGGVKDLMTKDTFHGFFGENKKLVSGGRYRPLSLVTFAAEISIFGKHPGLSHAINVLLYACTGLLLLLLLYKFFPPQNGLFSFLGIPFVATILFMAHPLHTEVVANIKGRDEIMCLLLSICSMWLIWKHSEKKNYFLYALALLSFMLACLSKENAITFLAVIPLSFWFFSSKKIKEIFILSIPFVVVAGIFWFLRGHFTGSGTDMEVTEILNNPFYGASVSQKFATIIFTFGKYLLLLVFPHPLTHDYYFNQIPIKSWSDFRVIFALLINVALLVFAMLRLQKKDVLSFSILFYFATFSVVSNVLFPIGVTMSERFVYVSSLGFCIAFAHLLQKAIKDWNQLQNNMVALSIVGVLVLGFSIKTIARNPAWQDNMTLFKTDIKNSPNSAKLNNSLGGQLVEKSDLEKDTTKRFTMLREGMGYLNHAVQIYPNYSIAWMLMGNGYYRDHQQYDKAILCYKNSLASNSQNRDAALNLAITYNAKGALREAVKAYYYYEGIVGNLSPEQYLNVEDIYKRMGEADSALLVLKKIESIKPDFPGLNREYGTIMGQFKNDVNEAIRYLNLAVQDNPKDATAWENLGVAYAISSNYSKAIQALEQALQLTPNNFNIYRNIANCYTQLGQHAKAQEMMSRGALMEAGVQRTQN